MSAAASLNETQFGNPILDHFFEPLWQYISKKTLRILTSRWSKVSVNFCRKNQEKWHHTTVRANPQYENLINKLIKMFPVIA